MVRRVSSPEAVIVYGRLLSAVDVEIVVLATALSVGETDRVRVLVMGRRVQQAGTQVEEMVVVMSCPEEIDVAEAASVIVVIAESVLLVLETVAVEGDALDEEAESVKVEDEEPLLVDADSDAVLLMVLLEDVGVKVDWEEVVDEGVQVVGQTGQAVAELMAAWQWKAYIWSRRACCLSGSGSFIAWVSRDMHPPLALSSSPVGE